MVKKDIYARARKTMVSEQLLSRGITNPRVIDAMLKVPRHFFVEEGLHPQAYSDFPLPIGEGQTISQPFMVAYMTEALKLRGSEKVLEVGTGCGYQAAVLSLVADRVFSIERISALVSRAKRTLDELGYSKVLVRYGDGTLGWPEEAPFDAILVAAGAPEVPKALPMQLSPDGGRLVIPVGDEYSQELLMITRHGDEFSERRLGGCRFVKLVGKNGWHVEGNGC